MPQNGGNPLIVLYLTSGPQNRVDSPPLCQWAEILFFFFWTKILQCWLYWLKSSYSSPSAFSETTDNFQIFVIVFLDFHFLILNTSVQNSSLALWPSIVSRALPLRLLSPSVALIHFVSMWARPKLSSLLFSGFSSGSHPWLHIRITQRAVLKCPSPDPSLDQWDQSTWLKY